MKKVFFITAFFSLFTSLYAVRETQSLNENWWFRFNHEAERNSGRRIDIPHTWNAQDALSGKPDYFRGIGNYSKTIFVPLKWKGKRIFVRFEGANSVTTFLVNTKYIGEHRGGYTAFIFDVTDFVKYGENNTLLARVDNSLNLDVMPLVGDFNFYGGIYRDVQLIVTENVSISLTDYASSGVYLLQKEVSKEKAEVEAKVMLSNTSATTRNVEVQIDVFDGKNNKILSNTVTNSLHPHTENQPVISNLNFKQPRLWNGVKDPFLYKVVVTLNENGSILDCVEQPLGLRFFSVDANNGFFLNGESYRLNGVCRHQERALYGNALQTFHHDEDVAVIREMGANAVRLSHYPQAPYFIGLLDKYGLVAWSEIPFVGPGGYLDVGFVDSKAFRENGKQQLKEMIYQLFNHPSICVWGLHNELKIEGDNPIEYLRELNALAHECDPSRPTTSASFQDGDINEVSDLIGWNKYFGWYGGPPSNMAVWADETHAQFPHLKISVSEYGAGASILHQQDSLQMPTPVSWWHPENWQTYYHIENWKILRERHYLWGTFIWAMFDFGSSVRREGDSYGRNDKGLVTIDRKIKKDAFYFYKANWNKEPMVYIAEKRNVMRKRQTTDILVFSNVKELELFVNGKSVGKQQPNEVAIVKWANITLSKGENEIEVISTDKKKDYNDSCVWILE